jgi:hypothetical protein
MGVSGVQRRVDANKGDWVDRRDLVNTFEASASMKSRLATEIAERSSSN